MSKNNDTCKKGDTREFVPVKTKSCDRKSATEKCPSKSQFESMLFTDRVPQPSIEI